MQSAYWPIYQVIRWLQKGFSRCSTNTNIVSTIVSIDYFYKEIFHFAKGKHIRMEIFKHLHQTIFTLWAVARYSLYMKHECLIWYDGLYCTLARLSLLQTECPPAAVDRLNESNGCVVWQLVSVKHPVFIKWRRWATSTGLLACWLDGETDITQRGFQ